MSWSNAISCTPPCPGCRAQGRNSRQREAFWGGTPQKQSTRAHATTPQPGCLRVLIAQTTTKALLGVQEHPKSPHPKRANTSPPPSPPPQRIQGQGPSPAGARGAGGWCPAEPPAPTSSPAAPLRSSRSLTLQNTRGGAGPRHPLPLLPRLHMRQQPCMLREAAEREPRPGRGCEWEGPLEAGKDVGKLGACFSLLSSSCVFPFLCQQLLSREDLISPGRRAALGMLGHRARMGLAGKFSLFSSCRSGDFQSLPRFSVNRIFMAPQSPSHRVRVLFALTQTWNACIFHHSCTGCRTLSWVAFLPSSWGSSGAFKSAKRPRSKAVQHLGSLG